VSVAQDRASPSRATNASLPEATLEEPADFCPRPSVHRFKDSVWTGIAHDQAHDRCDSIASEKRKIERSLGVRVVRKRSSAYAWCLLPEDCSSCLVRSFGNPRIVIGRIADLAWLLELCGESLKAQSSIVWPLNWYQSIGRPRAHDVFNMNDSQRMTQFHYYCWWHYCCSGQVRYWNPDRKCLPHVQRATCTSTFWRRTKVCQLILYIASVDERSKRSDRWYQSAFDSVKSLALHRECYSVIPKDARRSNAANCANSEDPSLENITSIRQTSFRYSVSIYERCLCIVAQ